VRLRSGTTRHDRNAMLSRTPSNASAGAAAPPPPPGVVVETAADDAAPGTRVAALEREVARLAEANALLTMQASLYEGKLAEIRKCIDVAAQNVSRVTAEYDDARATISRLEAQLLVKSNLCESLAARLGPAARVGELP